MTEAAAPDRPRGGAALVTGGAKRIGRAICLELAAAGFDLAIHHRESGDEAAQLAAGIRALGRRAVCLSADLADAEATGALVGRAVAALGPLSVLVNNASLFADDRLDTLTGESWSSHMDVNLRAPVLLAQAFAAQAAEGASIINILDQRVLKPDPRFFSYGLSKSALWVATRTMAQALAPRIRVNGEEAVSFAVRKNGGENTVAVSDAVTEELEKLAKTFPADIKLSRIVDQSRFVKDNANQVKGHIVFGGIIVLGITDSTGAREGEHGTSSKGGAADGTCSKYCTTDTAAKEAS